MISITSVSFHLSPLAFELYWTLTLESVIGLDFLLNPSTSLDDTPNSDSSQSSDSPPSSPTSSPTGPQAKRQKLNPTSRTLWKRERYNLTDDSPPFTDLNKYVLALAGATLAVAKEVSERRADVGICWDGGRHHAMRSAASGEIPFFVWGKLPLFIGF